MNICIIGWYGTETLGDRAILVGILEMYKKMFHNFDISLGCLFPEYTKRTLLEEKQVLKDVMGNSNIKIFNSRKKNELKNAIDESNHVIMGGGPLMDLYDIKIIRDAFIYAWRKGKKNIILGCGIGPLYKESYQETLRQILNHSSLLIFRDMNSAKYAENVLAKEMKVYSLQDPAILAIPLYQKRRLSIIRKEKRMVINFREFPNTIFLKNKIEENSIYKIIALLAKKFDLIELLPMHTFTIGGDDRAFLEKIKQSVNVDNITVRHKPMSIYDLFSAVEQGFGCCGMRYHSIVFQTFLNGNNIIFDYTNGKKGKIQSFIQMIDGMDFYKNRLYNINNLPTNNEEINKIIELLGKNEKFVFDSDIFVKTLNDYCDLIYNI